MPDIARRGFISAAWRAVESSDAAVKTTFLLAPQLEDETLLNDAADAQAEADRRLALRKVQRDRFQLTVTLDATTETLDIGDVVTLVHERYGLDAGRDFVIIGVDPDASTERLILTVWG